MSGLHALSRPRLLYGWLRGAGLIALAAWLAGGAGSAGAAASPPAPLRMASSAEAAPSVLLAPLAFVSDRDGNPGVYLLRPDGEVRKANDSPDPASAPVWSPDGTRLAFQTLWQGQPQVLIASPDGVSPFRPAGMNVYEMAWSPDGRQIAFTGSDFDVYVVDADGTRLRNLSHDFQRDWGPVWSPDGTMVAFSGRRGGAFDVFVAAADGSAVQNVTGGSGGGGQNFDPAWSPMGSPPLIVFDSNRDGAAQVYVVAPDGTGLRPLTAGPGNKVGPRWSPDGKWIAFESDQAGDHDVYTMSTDGGDARNLTRHPAADGAPTWSPDGTRIAFTSDRDGNFELYVMNADGTAPVNLTNDAAADCCAVWSPRASPPALGTTLGPGRTASPTAESPAGGPLRVGDLSFALPGPDWTRNSLTPNRLTVVLEKRAPSQESLVVHLQTPSPDFSRSQATARQWELEREDTSAGWSRSGFEEGARAIGGRSHPTLSSQAVPAQGEPFVVVDTVVLVYLPDDFEASHTFYTVAWSDRHAPSVPALDPGDLDALVASFALPPLGSTLLRDDFRDPTASVFRAETSGHFSAAFVDGEFAIRKTDPDWTRLWGSTAAGGPYANVLVSADVRTAADAPGQLAYVWCRRSTNPTTGYRGSLDLSTPRYQIQRVDEDQNRNLTEWQPLDGVAIGDTVHVELSCAGNMLAMSVNGGAALEGRDRKYAIGGVGIGGGTFSEVRGIADIRFSAFDLLQD